MVYNKYCLKAGRLQWLSVVKKWAGRANVIVSLLSIYKGNWSRERLLDGKVVKNINAHFEDSEYFGDPKTIKENSGLIYQGVIFLGDGFLLTNEQAHDVIQEEFSNSEVILPVINGQELNNHPLQTSSRSIICFFDWEIDKAKDYTLPYQIVEKKSKTNKSQK